MDVAEPSKTESDDEMDVTVSQVIDRPVEEVFHFFADNHVQNHPRWDPDIELEKESEGPIDVGTVIRRRNTRYETPVEGTMEITEFDRPRVFGGVIKEGPYEMRGWTTFEAQGSDQTKITLGTEVPDSIDRDMLRPKMERSAQNIKDLIESET